MPSKRIYLTRHAQAGHNVAEDYSIPDAELTPLGRQQSAQLHEETKDGLQQTVELIVSSPLRRPMQTMLVGYPDLKARLNHKVVLLPELQEVNHLPCDTGSSRAFLEEHDEFVKAGLDFSQIDESEKRHGVGWTSKMGFFDAENVIERAKWVRRWLRERKEEKIVVIAHGDILRVIQDGYRSDPQTHPWANAEVRAFTFASDDDEDAKLVLVKEVAKEGEEEPTSGEMKN
ncbi:histidine phosphatase superfamily [Leucosporidium creatinivorum]|uniref:Histidine phosphatase superfamily n=1 Tax=Leucosporidium creatinivorum TaxID=106004 RepID=A0A1Y2EPU5_9BASI|nr:histidine phosphatase superfamily [Leucosporidium creatinivorum]